jgi:predicted nucleotide-binding protein (sugar kinase/HSP70/actin superfamily)
MVAEGGSLTERRLLLPRMTDCGTEALAAAFRSVGIEACVLPPPDGRALALGAQHLGGEECLPAKVTLGDFLKAIEAPGFDPRRTAFMMPTTEGPCRFGQYAPTIKRVLAACGVPEVAVLSPTSGDGYRQMGDLGAILLRTAWRAVVVSDILRKYLLKTRPYERAPGGAEAAYTVSLKEVCGILERPGLPHPDRLARLQDALARIRDRFRAVPVGLDPDRLLVAVQGEIFCRMEEFSNDRLIRRLEGLGAEVWLADISEWMWYCNVDEEANLAHAGRRLSAKMLHAKLRDHVQQADEAALWGQVADDFLGYEPPGRIRAVLEAGWPYLPRSGAAGEMVLSVGKVPHLFRMGVDGILDISPFSCMNGIVSEGIYPRLSAEHAGLPIKVIYCDGTGRDLDQDLEIFLELARAYRRRKPHSRPCPGP